MSNNIYTSSDLTSEPISYESLEREKKAASNLTSNIQNDNDIVITPPVVQEQQSQQLDGHVCHFCVRSNQLTFKLNEPQSRATTTPSNDLDKLKQRIDNIEGRLEAGNDPYGLTCPNHQPSVYYNNRPQSAPTQHPPPAVLFMPSTPIRSQDNDDWFLQSCAIITCIAIFIIICTLILRA